MFNLACHNLLKRSLNLCTYIACLLDFLFPFFLFGRGVTLTCMAMVLSLSYWMYKKFDWLAMNYKLMLVL